MPDQLLNDRERPRILVRLADKDLVQQIAEVHKWPGTFVTWADATPLHWSEWDAIITDFPPLVENRPAGRDRFIPDGKPVFFIQHHQTSGSIDFESGLSESGLGKSRLQRKTVAGSNLFLQTGGVDREVMELACTGLFGDVAKRKRQWGFAVDVDDLFDTHRLTVIPFLKARGDVVVAGSYTRGDGITNWVVPNDTSIVPWLTLAFERWSRELPSVFPSAPAWEHSETWMSHKERDLVGRIRYERGVLAEAQRRHDEILEALHADGAALTIEEDGGSRRLLTATGTDLVEAVAEALVEIGFVVKDMDSVYPEGRRHEDLQVSLTQGEAWLAITEVTGVARGVAQEKWTKLNQHLITYLRQPNSVASALPWLFVNQHISSEPASRPILWQKDFWANVEESGGLAMETPALFTLVHAVRSGMLDSTQVQDFLRTFSGVLDLATASSHVQALAEPSS